MAVRDSLTVYQILTHSALFSGTMHKAIKAADLASVRGRRGSGQPSTKTTGDYSPFEEKVNDGLST